MGNGHGHTCSILATGGFQGDEALVADHIRPARPLRLRANPWSAGDGLRNALGRGGALSAGMDEFYGRNMPDADFTEADLNGTILRNVKGFAEAKGLDRAENFDKIVR